LLYKVNRQRYRDFVKVSVYKVSSRSLHMTKDLPPNPFAGLRVAITGGTSGLGLALVRELLKHGAQVAFVARRREGVNRIVREQRIAHGIVGDISKKNDIYPIAIQIVGALGGLDVLVNNASDLGPVPLALLGDTDSDDLERVLATNVLGPFRLTKALLGALASSARQGRGAVVVNVSSDAAINPYPRWGAYGASKAALHHLSNIWNSELAGAGISFLSFDPGDMDTPLHGLAVPDGDPSKLKCPEMAARELADAIGSVLSARGGSGGAQVQVVKETVYDTRQPANPTPCASEVIGG
jgi:NAD(P)-dependent dehydrogenase (short-subunit alcohol dehydrogenase family)